jgi:predicted alpha/beta-hydrolase family hydrolase
LSAANIRAFVDNSVDPPVRGFLHTPTAPNNSALVLTHGAGSNANAPLLVALAETFSASGFTVLRCDLPYRQTRSFGPPGPGDAARDRAGLKNAITAAKKMATAIERTITDGGAPLLADFARSGNRKDAEGGGCDPDQSKKYGNVYLGGHSYGGRQSSMLCAEEPDLVAGLLLLSYPLHPPRKPEQQRTQHLPNLRTPTLFIHGTRDPFGSIAEMEQALKMIPAKTKLIAIEGTGHDLGFKGKATKADLPKETFSRFEDFFPLEW